MARILIVTGGLRGMLHASLAMARRLVADGHEVIYAWPEVGDPEVGASVRQQGIEALVLAPNQTVSFQKQDAGRPLLERLTRWGERRRSGCKALGVSGFAETIRQHGFDLVLIDIELHGHVFVACAAGARVALLNSFVSIWKRPGLPPPHRLARPGVGWRGSAAGMELLWLELRLRKALRRWLQWLRFVGCDSVSLLRELAEEVGYPYARRVDRGQWLIPFTDNTLPVLCLHGRELEFPHRLRQGVHYVGPMIQDRLGESYARERRV